MQAITCGTPGRLRERWDAQRGSLLRQWLEQAVQPTLKVRILEVDAAVARRSAAKQIPDPQPFRDGLIAATTTMAP